MGRGGIYPAQSQPLFNCPSPAGWPDEAAAWLTASAIDSRIAWAERAGARARIGPRALLETALGPLASGRTRAAVAGAADAAQGVALVLMSPEFQRR